MSLGCGEGREIIGEGFSLLYRLGTNEKGLELPDEENQVTPPNSAVCDTHLRQVPDDEFKDSPEGIEGVVYAVANANGTSIYDETAVSLQGLKDDKNYRFLSHQAIEKYLPKALEIIEDF